MLLMVECMVKCSLKTLQISVLVYRMVKKIPRGKVTTYGQIALRLRSGSATKITPRLVGRVLHLNPDPRTIPCHRVVNSKGKIALNFAFGGASGQRRRLLAEGIKFKNKMYVVLNSNSCASFT